MDKPIIKILTVLFMSVFLIAVLYMLIRFCDSGNVQAFMKHIENLPVSPITYWKGSDLIVGSIGKYHSFSDCELFVCDTYHNRDGGVCSSANWYLRKFSNKFNSKRRRNSYRKFARKKCWHEWETFNYVQTQTDKRDCRLR